MKKAALFLLAPALLWLSGCAHDVIPFVTPLQFDPASMELLGPVTGSVSKTSILWGMFEAPPVGDGFSTQDAIRDALEKVHGDALLNPTVDQDTRNYFGFYYVATLRVSGLAVRFKNRPKVPLDVDDTPLPAEPTPTPIVTPSPTPVPHRGASSQARPSSASGSRAGH